jgi:hypothetical protein
MNKLKKTLGILLIILTVLTSVKFLILKPKNALADSLLSFDEGYGTTTSDTNSSIATGTIVNAVWKTEDLCKFGKCLYFDGTGDYVSYADNASLDMDSSDNVTIEGWFRTPDITSGTRTLISKEETTGADGGYKITINSSGQIIFGIDSDNTSFPLYSVTSTQSFDDNLWHHFSAVKSSTTSMTLYLDAVQVGTTSITSTSASNDDIFYIGIDNGATNGFTGFIDEVKVLRTARSQAEIKTDYLEETPNRGASVSIGGNNSWISNGLVGYWKMDETSGNAVDSSGNGNTATWAGTGSHYVAGKFGNGGGFNGTDDYVRKTSFPTNLKTMFTYSTWIKTGADCSGNYYLMEAEYAEPTMWIQSCLLKVNLRDPGGSSVSTYTGASTLAINTWYHVAATYDDASDSVKIFVNGKLDGTGTHTSVGNLGGGVTFDIGGRATAFFNGVMDDVRVYNRALSPVEVQDLYQYAPGPVGHWKLDENTGTTANDSTGNGNNGTLTNAPTWGNGKFGSGVTFDTVATNKYITVPAATSINNLSQFTYSFWINPTQLQSRDIIRKGGGLQIYFDTVSGGLRIQTHLSCSTTDMNRFTTSADNLSLNAWHHISFSYDGQGCALSNVKLYIDGVPATQHVNSTDGSGTRSSDSGNNLIFGNEQTFTNQVQGTMDDVKLYSYTRTPEQVIEDMSARGGSTLGGNASAVGHYKFDEGYGTTAKNYGLGGSTFNGTITGATWSNNGKYNKALNFAGSTNSVAVNSISNIKSVSFWVNPSSTTESLLSLTATIYVSASSGTITATGFTSPTIYVNGKVNSTLTANTWQNIIITTETPITGSAITLGRANGTSLNGLLDEVKIYKGTLSSDEIKLDYNKGSSIQLGSFSDTSLLTGGSVASNSATAIYCVPGASDTCTPPIAEWKFEEATGTSVNDTSGVTTAGTWNGTGNHWKTGKIGLSGGFNGTDDYVNLGTFNSLNGATSFTISFWIYKEEDGNFPTFDGVLGIGTSGQRTPWIYGVSGAQNLTTQFETTTGGVNDCAVGSGTITANAWSFVTLRWTGSACQFFVNGIPIGTADATTGSVLANTDGTNYLGRLASFDYWNGGIDQFRIYNYARTPEQIAWDYNQGKPIAHWKMEELATPSYDSSGNNYHLTWSGNVTQITGKFNKGTSYDGTNDWLACTDASCGGIGKLDFNATATFSYGTWFNSSTVAADVLLGKKFAPALNTSVGYVAYLDASGNLFCTLADGTNETNSTVTGVFADGTWHHVMCVVTTNTVDTYVDGKLKKSQAKTTTATLDNTYDFRTAVNGGDNNDFTGSLDDVRIYNYSLTPSQVKMVYDEGSAVRFGP